ncbi:MAG TPA: hypothetical protein DEP53_16500 [Bacteroidetes bacterium]|nr:hypothetical protein [Bacteroidota bacterium]
MRGSSKLCSGVAAVLVLAFTAQSAKAENRLLLKKQLDKVLAIELRNDDPIAGFQFSVNARGGLTFGSFEGGVRTAAAGLLIYQFSQDDSTLNVLVLAPPHLALSAGEGILGTISFTLNEKTGSDTNYVFLSRVVLCNADAEYVDVTTTELKWTNPVGARGPSSFVLERNFPNPFNPSTTISYSLDAPAKVQLVVFDLAGRQIATLVDQFQSAGRYAVRWNAAERSNLTLASGIYFVRLHVGSEVAVQKVILAK